MLTWQDPVADHDVPAPAGAWHETIENSDVGGAILHAPVDAPSGLRGTFAVAASRAPGVTVTVRDRFDATADKEVWADFASDGRLEPAIRPAPERAPERRSGSPSRRPWTWNPASAGRSGSRSPGTSRSSSSGPDGAGTSATRAIGAGPARGRSTSPRTRWSEAPRWRAAIEAWQRPVLASPSGPTGTRRRSSTSSTSWSTAAPSGRPARSTEPSRHRTTRAASRSSSASTTRSTTASTSTSTHRSRSCGSSPSSSCAASATSWRPIAVDDPAIVAIEASGDGAPRKVGGTVPHDVGGPDDDPFYRPNRYHYQDVNDWKDLGPKFVLQVWRDAVAAGADGDALIRDAWPTVEALLTRLARRDRDGDGLPEHDGLPDQTYDTWPMHGPSAYGGLALAGCAGGRRGDGRPAGRDRGRAALGGLVRTRPGRLRPAPVARRPLRLRRRRRGQLRQHHGRPARRPVVRRRDRPRRPPARATGSRPRCGPSTG